LISPEIEARALEYLAQELFCSPFEIATVVALWDGDATETEALITDWADRGWVEILSQDGDGPELTPLPRLTETKLPPLLHLTDAGRAEVERRRPAS